MKRLMVMFALLVAGPVPAIVVQDYEIAKSDPSLIHPGFNWNYIYNYKNSSAVAVGSHWLLTAAHVADDGGTGSVIVGGVTFYQQEVIFHDSADLALIRYDKPFSGYYPMHEGEIYTGSRVFRTYQELVMVGFGFDGVASSSSFTQGSFRGIKRWGTNKGEAESTISADIIGDDGVPDVSTKCFQMDFNLGESSYEAGANIYDSGGPVFIDSNGEWALTGIILYRNGTGPYTGNYAAMIHDYSAWAEASMDAVSGDNDADGLPNWWEQQYGSTTGVVATTDQDGDGQSGYDEYVADTDPTDPDSFFKMDAFAVAEGQAVTFDGSTARQYQLFYTTNGLADAALSWSPAHSTPVWGTGAGSSIAVTNTEPAAFYRLRVTLP